jgi:hypothetical protein
MGLALKDVDPFPPPAPKEFDPAAVHETPELDQLVLNATTTSDPAVYALALGRCAAAGGGLPLAGSCQGLSASHWAEMDPDNAVPWLMVADQAHSAHDPTRESEAFERVVHASRRETYTTALYAAARAAMPSSLSPLARAVAGAKLFALAPSSVSVPIGIFSGTCSEEALHDARRRENCAALANSLLDHSSTFWEMAVGVELAGRLGFPSGRFSADADELGTLRRGLQRLPTAGARTFNCAAVAEANDYLDLLIDKGEPAAMKAVVTQGTSRAAANGSSGSDREPQR